MNYIEYLNKKVSQSTRLKDEILYNSWIKEIGIMIARARKDKGFTQKELADKIGVPQSVIARIEAGSNYKCSTLWSLSKALNTDINIFGASIFWEKIKFDKVIKPSNQVEIFYRVGVTATQNQNLTTQSHAQTSSRSWIYGCAA